ncbi:MAG: M14 family metallocarboxypeptidase [Nitrospinales bacterium]
MPENPLKKRDYNAVLQRLNSFSAASGFPVQAIGEISVNGNACPIVRVDLTSGRKQKKTMLVSAGIHGDEPAGVEAVCAFLRSRELQNYYREEWEFSFLPCLNPYGYEYGIRENHEGKDLNRLFKCAAPPPEVVAAQETLRRPFDVTVELHEDSESPGYYLYQKVAEPAAPSLGRLILQAVEPIMPINANATIEGMPASQGVIDRFSDPDKMDWWPMALYAGDRGARNCFTLETALKFPMQTRIDAHLRAIQTILKNYSTR